MISAVQSTSYIFFHGPVGFITIDNRTHVAHSGELLNAIHHIAFESTQMTPGGRNEKDIHGEPRLSERALTAHGPGVAQIAFGLERLTQPPSGPFPAEED